MGVVAQCRRGGDPSDPAIHPWRRLTEARLRELFLAKGGRPQRSSPHYFCLGDSEWFAGLAADTESVSLSLTALPPDSTSLTLIDSFTAMGFGPQFGFPAAESTAESAVYRLDETQLAQGLSLSSDSGGAFDFDVTATPGPETPW